MDYARLKARHRAEREGYPQNLSLRVHRALSWLDRAERAAHELVEPHRRPGMPRGRRDADLDAQFIFLWIAFNAAHATEMARLVLLIIEIMMDHPETPWGDPCYPVVDGA
jgi:hypothetical protein